MAKGIHTAVFSILLCSTILHAGDKLNIAVTPRIVGEGQTVRITCHVPRHPDNRRLTYGVTNYLESDRDLEGENSAVTWQALIQHVPCEATAAYCVVVRNDGTYERVALSLEVAGCER